MRLPNYTDLRQAGQLICTEWGSNNCYVTYVIDSKDKKQVKISLCSNIIERKMVQFDNIRFKANWNATLQCSQLFALLN